MFFRSAATADGEVPFAMQPEFDTDLKKYIQYAKRIKPILTQEASDRIADVYSGDSHTTGHCPRQVTTLKLSGGTRCSRCRGFYSAPIEFTAYDDSGSIKSSEVMSSSASKYHLSVGTGVGIDLLFLEGSVSVHYDKDDMENRDSDKASVTTSYSVGTVAFMRPPELLANAFGVLHRHVVLSGHRCIPRHLW
ncbi:hypothetical protein TGAMA5MH_00490 [Trichoderma gamsii]|uniref:Uncharacterized protein n=1 Tax=Trichoderma gamsii TaxID=398673 RepID=A0A2K0TSE9_9HYPO|nr:hypothetical protein TGAMA5MH_00490 [Trichoderma gamsii]